MITHQKRTMEVADALYVTMRGDGVSAVISNSITVRVIRMCDEGITEYHGGEGRGRVPEEGGGELGTRGRTGGK